MTHQAAASVLTYRLGGREYPLRSAPGCKTCAHPERMEIESQIAKGRTYATIARALLAGDPDSELTARNIRNHYDQGHMPLDVEAARRLVEQRAAEIGRDIDAGVEELVDQVTLARTVVQQTYERIAAGEIRPEIADGVAAARLLHQMGVDDTEVDQSAWVEAFVIYHETAQRHMTPDQFASFGRDLSANPVLRALQEKHSDGSRRQRELDG